ncbi:MAG: hypothetical protein KAU02_03530 [Tenericutes bacterium]|nr:hypothetical protein [Mycoplasmatota bacterium]
MIIEVKSKRDLKKFLYFVKNLYKGDSHYIYPLFYVLYRELVKEVLKDGTYKAILDLNEHGMIQGRLMYTIEHNIDEDIDICYWSYFESINSIEVINNLFNYMEQDMRDKDVYISEGSFIPYDPDNRRGILIDGFEKDPVIFTSYNKQYYKDLLEMYGHTKSRDSFSVIPFEDENTEKKLKKFARFFERRNNVCVSSIDFKNIDKEIDDIHKILLDADNDHIYQEVPSIKLIRDVADNLRMFLDPRLIKIAREIETGRPVGFIFCLLDFNQVFKKTNGKIKPIKMLLYKKKITKARGMMQYMIPEYQGKGLIGFIYKEIYDEMIKMGLKEFEAGTIMEGNEKSLTSLAKFNGKVAKTYRIYRKDHKNG